MNKLHPSLPQSLTPENLGTWIAEHSIENKFHNEKIDYTKEEIQAFEHTSAKLSIELEKLNKIADNFKKTLKKGTPIADPEKQTYEDVRILIPGTKGTEILEAERQYASNQIELGHRIETTKLYGIPYSEERLILFFDIEGNDWDQHKYKMNPHQVEKYGNPLFDEKGKSGKQIAKDFHDNLAKDGMKVTGVKGNAVEVQVTRDRGPEPSEEEQSLFDN